MGRVQDDRDHPGRAGVPVAGPGRLSALETKLMTTMSWSDFLLNADLRCPLWVIRVRVRPAAAPAMSVMPRKRRSATKMRSVAMGHKQTYAVQQRGPRLLEFL